MSYGVITEQGYPAGQFGFDKVSPEDQKALESNEETKDSEDKK